MKKEMVEMTKYEEFKKLGVGLQQEEYLITKYCELNESSSNCDTSAIDIINGYNGKIYTHDNEYINYYEIKNCAEDVISALAKMCNKDIEQIIKFYDKFIDYTDIEEIMWDIDNDYLTLTETEDKFVICYSNENKSICAYYDTLEKREK